MFTYLLAAAAAAAAASCNVRLLGVHQYQAHSVTEGGSD